jgi:hypothetical protein
MKKNIYIIVAFYKGSERGKVPPSYCTVDSYGILWQTLIEKEAHIFHSPNLARGAISKTRKYAVKHKYKWFDDYKFKISKYSLCA